MFFLRNAVSNSLQEQVERASSLWNEFNLDSEESMVPLPGVSSSFGAGLANPGQAGMPAPAAKKGSKKGADKAGGRPKSQAQQNHDSLVLASRLRARSESDVSQAERLLKKAVAQAEKVLTKIAPEVVQVETDITLDLIKSRSEMVALALDTSNSPAACAKFQQLMLLDP